MKKSLVVVGILLAVALAGLAIGMAGMRARHLMANHPGAGSAGTSTAVGRNNATKDNRTLRVIRFAKNPLPAPPFLVNDLDGNFVSTAAWRGKVVMLNFWATWCPPCREEIHELISLAN